MTSSVNGACALQELGVISVQGEEAAKFLQGQLTQDFALLGLSEARLAAFCTPKGRMLASFLGLRRADPENGQPGQPGQPGRILLVMSRDILAPTLKRLSMFVLRTKARLTDASEEFDLYGLVGDAARAALADAPTHPWARRNVGDASLVRLYPADGHERALRIAPTGHPAPQGDSLAPAVWNWTEVRSGIARISAPVVEAFVPQMLNYESVGGVNFKKGCYPGQEVVARSQFRGTLKKRAYLAHCDAEMTAGQEVFHESDVDQPCGTVAQAAPSPVGGWDAIVSMQIVASQGGAVMLGAAGGPALRIEAPPYPLLADV